MSHAESRTSSTAGGETAQASVCVLLACFEGAGGASKIRRSLGKQIREGGAILDEVVLKVSAKRKVQVHDPRRTVAGTLTSALTWGLFGLAASGGSWTSLVLWAVIGAVCGGLFAYYTEHTLTKTELERIGTRLAPDSSALAVFVETEDATKLVAATAPYEPATASAAAIGGDLSAHVVVGASHGDTLPASVPGAHREAAGSDVTLSMLLLRYKGEHAVRGVKAPAGVQTELLFEVDRHGKARVSSPATGTGAMAKSDVLSWGLFGVAFGVLVGLAGNGGILSTLDDGLVTGLAWAIFGLVAGALYGLWAGRSVSARRLQGLGPLLPPDSSSMLAWAEGANTEQTITELSTPGTERLILHFKPAGNGAILEV